MEFLNQHLITILVFLPLAGAFSVLLFLRGTQKEAVRWVTFLTMLAGFVISLKLFVDYDPQSAQTMQFIESSAWLPEYGIVYKVGIGS
jgi:NADH-quinone oxidoreductase subunit M